MTAQSREILLFEGEELRMAAEPLNPYLEKNNFKFLFPSTACWRGYYGTWALVENKLYLRDLQAYVEDYKEVDLNYLFPDKKRVFAYWFSGQVRVEKGELLHYVHADYYSIYEKELILEFENGILISKFEIDNTDKILPDFDEVLDQNEGNNAKLPWWRRFLKRSNK